MGNHPHAARFSTDWLQVATDGGLPVLILDAEARILLGNAAAARVFARNASRDLAGHRLNEILPAPAALERADVARQVIHSGEPAVFRELWSGVAFRATVRSIDAGAGAPAAIWVFAPEDALAPEPSEKLTLRTVEARHIDLGPLCALTASELKVLALIGEGLSNADIAARLHRAVKTVESHRASLTEKTGSASRVQLGIMARRAGLIRRVALNDARHTSIPA